MSNEKVVFITASAGAIGEAQARLFSSNGYKVYLTDLNEKSVEIISKDINLNGGETSFAKLDVTHEKEWKQNFEKCMNKFNRIDFDLCIILFCIIILYTAGLCFLIGVMVSR